MSENITVADQPEDQIKAIKQVLSGVYGIESLPFLKEGNQVEVIAGPLLGLEGILQHINQNLRLVISVDMIGRSVAVEIEPHFLRIIT